MKYTTTGILVEPRELANAVRPDTDRDYQMMRDHTELHVKSGFTPAERVRAFEPVRR